MSPLIPRTSLAVILVFCLLASTHTQAAGETTSEAAMQVITDYRTNDPSSRVQAWKQVITHPSGNPKFREFQAERLREWQKTEFAPYRLDNPEIIALITEVVWPVLELYRRQNCFKILVVDHHVPVAMNDSGVLLMITTGLIERATSDDEILGHIAHELGHDLFWRRTDKARRALELYKSGTNTELLARQAKEELAKIELECDAFSATTLAALGRNPVFFGQYLLNVEQDFSDYIPDGLPAVALRVQVIESVPPSEAKRVAPQQSEAFKKLKALFANASHKHTG